VDASIQTSQESGRREMTSLSRRSPAENPAFVSSPTISATDATSSAAPGGCTGPLAASASHSKPCRGAASCLEPRARRETDVGRWADVRPRADPPGRLEALGARLPVEARAAAGRPAARSAVDSAGLCGNPGRSAPLLGAVSAPARPAFRAATRRRLARWGRVRGRLPRTPCSFCWAFAKPSLELVSITQHIIA
jgi:hypothetical protein